MRCPNRYCCHFLTTKVIAKSSLTYAEARSNLGLKGLLKKAMGWPFCDRTAPMPTPDASVSRVNGREKFGSIRTGAVVRASFNFVNACWAA